MDNFILPAFGAIISLLLTIFLLPRAFPNLVKHNFVAKDMYKIDKSSVVIFDKNFKNF